MWQVQSQTGYLSEWSTRERKRKKSLCTPKKDKRKRIIQFKKLSHNINLTFKIIYIIIILGGRK